VWRRVSVGTGFVWGRGLCGDGRPRPSKPSEARQALHRGQLIFPSPRSEPPRATAVSCGLAHLCTTTKGAASPFGGFSKGEHHGRRHHAISLTPNSELASTDGCRAPIMRDRRPHFRPALQPDSKTDRKNQTIQYVYDSLYRMTSKTYPDSTAANYAYDLV
jgi:YD repeat-containing protein